MNSASQAGANTVVHEADQLPKTQLPSVGKSIGMIVVFMLVSYGVGVLVGFVYGAYLGITNPGLVADDQLLDQAFKAFVFSPAGFFWLFFVQSVVLLPLVIWISHFKQQPWQETLALKAVARPVIVFWLLVVCGYMVISMLANTILDIQPGEMMQSMAGSRHLGLFLVIVFLAPVVEEFFFRGYLFRAWRHTKLGLWGTLVLTSVLFALLHGAQYPVIILGFLFILSVLLGLAREKTGSIWPPVAMHVGNNAVAGAFVIYFGVV
jgi:uncharacterized protein